MFSADKDCENEPGKDGGGMKDGQRDIHKSADKHEGRWSPSLHVVPSSVMSGGAPRRHAAALCEPLVSLENEILKGPSLP